MVYYIEDVLRVLRDRRYFKNYIVTILSAAASQLHYIRRAAGMQTAAAGEEVPGIAPCSIRVTGSLKKIQRQLGYCLAQCYMYSYCPDPSLRKTSSSGVGVIIFASGPRTSHITEFSMRTSASPAASGFCGPLKSGVGDGSSGATARTLWC